MQRSTQKKKQSKKVGFIIGGVLLLLVVLFFGYQFYNGMQQGKKTVEAFTSAIEKGKYEQLGQYLTDESLKNNGYTKDDVIKKYQSIFTGIEAKNIKASNIKTTKEKFTYQLSLDTGLGKLKTQEYSGTLSADKKKIEWTPALIFPDMEKKDRINYQPETALRGEILDRNGEGLATNGTIYQLGITPKNLGTGAEKQEKINAIAKTLGLTADDVNGALKQGWVKDDLFVPLKTTAEKTGETADGLDVHEMTGRVYPLKEAAAQLIGYVGKATAEDLKKNKQLVNGDSLGKTGLEQALDEKIRGKNGGTLTIIDEKGAEKKVLQSVAKKDGESVKLTIDSRAQQLSYLSLAKNPGASVVMAPKTGDLLAAASSPSFDPNKMTNGISQADYDVYNNDKNHPFQSRFATRYAPGSTFKMVTTAIGLDAGTLKPDEGLPISGLKWQKSSAWGGYQVTRVSDVDPVDLKAALVYSDNIYVAQETLKMGEKTFRSGLNKFIFGKKFDLPIEMNPAQISNKDAFGSEILLADTGYGQGQLLINPIQQITNYSVFPNNGTLVYPKLLASAETKKEKDIIKESSAALISKDLEAVVTDPAGTAHSLQALGVPLAAKTGTAEIKEKQDERGKQNSFLYAYDPTNTAYSVLEFLEDKTDDQSATALSMDLLRYLQQTYN